MSELIPLFDDVYAVKFPYHMVTERTLSMAIPSDFMREVAKKKLQIKFAAESVDEAGQKRADSAEIGRIFPAELAILYEQIPDEAELSDYVIFKLYPQTTLAQETG